LLIANRDEFYARPTAPLAFWDDEPDLLAGRDLQAGGTWLGVTRQGRFAAITNYRDPRANNPDAPSRGALVSDYLRGRGTPVDYLTRLVPRAAEYNGFNLLVGDGQHLFYYSNQDGSPRCLEPGFYGLSNHVLNTPWPKLERGRAGLLAQLQGPSEPATDDLLELLADRTRAADEHLPDTGVPREWERILSSIFIESPGYGTRTSNILRLYRDGRLSLSEKNWSDGSLREFSLTWPAPEPTIQA
jgi:uncharacterized protein with NRDE domain